MKRYMIHLALALALVATYAVAQNSQNQSTPDRPAADQNAGTAQEGQQAKPDEQREQDRDRDKQARDKDRDRDKDKHAAGEKRDDQTLEREVRDQLASKPEFQNVKVEVKNRIVTLSGSVPRKEDRKEVAQLAKSVSGVKGVKENLSISASGAGAAASTQTSTENTAGSIAGNTGGQTGEQAGEHSQTIQVQNQVQQALREEPALAASNINVNVTNNQLVLNGSVPNEEAKRKAGEIAESRAGGLQIINNINVSSSAAANAGGVTGGATGAATGQAQPPASGVQAGTAGAVGSQAGTQSQGAAGATSGVAGSQLQTQIQNALQQEPTLSSCNLTTNVTDDAIQLSGTCPTGKEKQTAVRMAQSFAANRRVVDRITVTGRGREEREQRQVPPQSPPPQL